MARAVRIAALGAVLVPAAATTARAHRGPPFPIIMEEPAGDVRVSVWADPDIGEATFLVIIDTPDGDPPTIEPRVSIWVEPLSGRLAREAYPGRRQEIVDRMQFIATPRFDRNDHWRVGVRIDPPTGEAVELIEQVESTPPGLGVLGVAASGVPFVLMGGLWVVALHKRRRYRRLEAAHRSGRAGS